MRGVLFKTCNFVKNKPPHWGNAEVIYLTHTYCV